MRDPFFGCRPGVRPQLRRPTRAESDRRFSDPGCDLVEAVKRSDLFAALEGAACLPALRMLIEEGFVSEGDRVVIFNTGSGIKYLESVRIKNILKNAFDAKVLTYSCR
jgi:hypothetical protein